jgi:hypothetical protein
MLSNRAIGMAVLLAICFSTALAQERSATSPAVSQTEFKVLTDARLGLAKAALQLTPEQQNLWLPVESAVRNRAETRYRRLTGLRERAQLRQGENPVKALQERADALSQRGAELRKVADARQPLYESLNDDQKRRMGILATRVLSELRTAAQNRQLEMDDDDDEEF